MPHNATTEAEAAVVSCGWPSRHARDAGRLFVPYVAAGWVNPVSRWSTIRELSGRLPFLSVGRYAVKVRPLLVDNIRFCLVNKPGCQHERIGASVPLTTIIGV